MFVSSEILTTRSGSDMLLELQLNAMQCNVGDLVSPLNAIDNSVVHKCVSLLLLVKNEHIIRIKLDLY